MNTKGRPASLVAWVLLLVSAAAAGGCGRGARAPEALSEPSRVSSATLERDLLDSGEKRRLVVSDRKTIDSLLALARFETKNPCACAHLESIAFATDRGTIDVSLCRHCFDVAEKGSVTYYSMTPEFYAEFQRLLETVPPEKAR